MNDFNEKYFNVSDWVTNSCDNNKQTKEFNAEIYLHCNHKLDLTYCIMTYIMRNITNVRST